MEPDNVLFDVPAAVGPDGTMVDWRLRVMPDQIQLYETGEQSEQSIAQFWLAQVTKVEAENLVGNGRLVLWTEDRPQVVTRYSVEHTAEYATIANYLNRMIEEGQLRPVEPFEQATCNRCGRRFLTNSKICPACVDTRKVLGRLWSIMRPFLPLILAAAAIFWVITGVSLVIPQLQRILVDDVLRPQIRDVRLLLILVGGIALGRTVVTGATVIRGRLMVRLSAKLGRELREMVYVKIQALSLRFIDQKKTGDLMNRITGDTNQIQSFMQHQLPEILNQLLLFIGIGIILFASSWQLALLVLVPAPVVVWVSRLVRKRIRRMFHRQWRFADRANSLLQDILSGIRVVKAFGGEKREIQRFTHDSALLRDIMAENEKTWNTLYPALGFVMGVGHFLILYFGGLLVLQQEMLVGELIQFSTYAGMIYGPLQYMTFIPRWFHQAMTSCERIFEVIDQTPDVADAPDALAVPSIEGQVSLDKVTFGYVKHKPVLKDINIQIAAGEMLGLVGHSGAGKSTMINLINRFYDVDEGEILIDGINIRQLSQRDLRRQIGVVLQETFLFAGTIWENIAYANPDASAEAVMWAAKVANAHDFIIKFPDGYDTRVGERGQRLSGGERQRISIARAVLHNPKILILDEATSSVDTETERLIQEALRRLVANRTTIAIAHRLSTLKDADRILVLDHGEQKELGTHQELMQLKGTYYRLVMAQREMNKLRTIG